MRAFLSVLSCFSLAAWCACSSDAADPEQNAGTLQPGAGSGGTTSAGPMQPPAAPETPPAPAAGGSTATSPEAPPGPIGLAGASASEGGPSAPPTAMGGPTTGGPATGGAAGAGSDEPEPPPMVAGVCPPGPFAASPLIAGATPQPVCTGMTFTEGAVWRAELSTLFFSDFQIGGAANNYNGRIMTFTPGGQCQQLIADTGTNGLAIAPDGQLLGASHADQTLIHIDMDSRETSVFVAANAVNPPLNAPNDIAVRSDGNLYFTDPTFLLAGRNPGATPKTYRRDPSGALSVIDTGNNPNGINLSPDEKLLYLSHMGPNNVLVLDVDDSGGVSNSRTFIPDFGSDGMAVDCAGNLYLTTGGTVRVYSPQAELIGTIAAQGAANVAFGGPERKTLFITATTRLLQIELAIPGLPY